MKAKNIVESSVFESKPELEEQIPLWAKIQDGQGEILWGGAPICYRADGSDGTFWRGTDVLGRTLDIVVFDWRWQAEARWGFPFQAWLDLACVIDGLPSVLSLKKNSASNAFEWLMSLQKRGVLSCAQQVRLGFSEWTRPGSSCFDDDSYFQVEVLQSDWIAEEEFNRIRQFVVSGKFEYVLLGEIAGALDDQY